MMKISFIFFFSFMVSVILQAQDSLTVKESARLNAQSILMVKTDKKRDSTQYKTPKFKQGIFCDFEDQLNRKKVPIDFSLGNSKY